MPKRIQVVVIGECLNTYDPTHTEPGRERMARLKEGITYPVSEVWTGEGKRFEETEELLDTPQHKVIRHPLLGERAPLIRLNAEAMVWKRPGNDVVVDPYELTRMLRPRILSVVNEVRHGGLIITELPRVRAICDGIIVHSHCLFTVEYFNPNNYKPVTMTE